MEDRYIREIRIDWELLQMEDGLESYYKEILALKKLRELKFHENITFFVGENGSGKSTLLEGIAVAYGFNPEGGSMNYRFSSKDTHGGLHKGIQFVRGIHRAKDGFFLRAESFYNVASQMEELAGSREDRSFLSGYGGKYLHEQSHGESFLAIIQNRLWGEGVYLLDEPEAALSPQRQLTLLLYISRLAKEGSQFIIATHSPILLGMPGAEIYSFDDNEITRISYEETDCYQVMEMYINHREVILKRLLE